MHVCHTYSHAYTHTDSRTNNSSTWHSNNSHRPKTSDTPALANNRTLTSERSISNESYTPESVYNSNIIGIYDHNEHIGIYNHGNHGSNATNGHLDNKLRSRTSNTNTLVDRRENPNAHSPSEVNHNGDTIGVYKHVDRNDGGDSAHLDSGHNANAYSDTAHRPKTSDTSKIPNITAHAHHQPYTSISMYRNNTRNSDTDNPNFSHDYLYNAHRQTRADVSLRNNKNISKKTTGQTHAAEPTPPRGPPSPRMQQKIQDLSKQMCAKFDMAITAFKSMDKKGSGFLEVKDIERALGEAGIIYEKPVLERMIEAADLSYDGTIEYPEFVEFFVGR